MWLQELVATEDKVLQKIMTVKSYTVCRKLLMVTLV